MLEALGNWLATLGFIELMNAYDWLWPVCEIIHFIGMALLIGSASTGETCWLPYPIEVSQFRSL